MTDRIYKVGDGVWYASFGTHEVTVPCPVCYGNKKVLVTLGNGDEVSVECEYCRKGYHPASGFITEYVTEAKADYKIISSRRIEDNGGEEVIEYVCADHHLLYPDRMFDTEAEALAKAEQMKTEKDAEKGAKYKNEKSYSWNAGYHLKAAEKAKKEAQYHEEKAAICKSKAKT